MRWLLRAVTAALCALFFGVLLAPISARAGDSLDVQGWLARPGVRLVAVEFYATWCKPCMEAMPRWKKLKEKYGSQGLRIVVVNTQDPDGGCRALPFVPDETVCDLEGNVAEAYKLQGKLPSAYLWSWQGNLLVAKGHIEEVEKAVEAYLNDAPRVVLEGGDGIGREELRALRDRLTEGGKVLVLSGNDEKAALAAAKRAGAEEGKEACEIGKEVPPNALLKATRVTQGKASYLNLSMLDLRGGCLLSSASSEWGKDLRRVTQDATAKLLAKLRRPGGFQSPVASQASRAPAEHEPKKPEERREDAPSEAQTDDVIVTFESTPGSAKVEVDGIEVCAKTPCKKLVKAGKRAVRMSDACLVTKVEKVELKGDEQLVSVALDRAKASLEVKLLDERGAPAEGEVRLDGVVVGRSGKLLPVPACARDLVASTKEGAATTQVATRAGEKTSVTLRIPPPGMAAIPSGSLVRDVGAACFSNEGCKQYGAEYTCEKRASDSGMTCVSKRDVPALFLDLTEVPVEAYAACVSAGRCTKPVRTGAGCNFEAPGKARHPVNCVYADDAKAYCEWAGKRLPSADEWAHAAEGPLATKYPWGGEEPSKQLCWSGKEDRLQRALGTCPVASMPAGANAYGIHDLAGNVQEWTQTCPKQGYREDCRLRLVMGGDWTDKFPDHFTARSSTTHDLQPSPSIGFRCARAVDPSAETSAREAREAAAKSATSKDGRLCGRYIVEDPGENREQSGSGLVLDTRTGLRWLRFDGPGAQTPEQSRSFCANLKMRLPTLAEAEGIAGEVNACVEAWPNPWMTWTEPTPPSGSSWRITDTKNRVASDGIRTGRGLCVR